MTTTSDEYRASWLLVACSGPRRYNLLYNPYEDTQMHNEYINSLSDPTAGRKRKDLGLFSAVKTNVHTNAHTKSFICTQINTHTHTVHK